MNTINVIAIVVASVAAFIASGAYYAIFASRAARYSDAWADTSSQPAWKLIQEPFRTLLTSTVVAALVVAIGVTGVAEGLVLAGGLWIGFPLVLLAGSVIHENVPWQLAAIHAGDWLLKLLVIGAIVGVWR